MGMVTTSEHHADAFNAAYPVDTPVLAFTSTRDGHAVVTRTRSEAWPLPSGVAVVLVDNVAGGIALTHIEVLPRDLDIRGL